MIQFRNENQTSFSQSTLRYFECIIIFFKSLTRSLIKIFSNVHSNDRLHSFYMLVLKHANFKIVAMFLSWKLAFYYTNGKQVKVRFFLDKKIILFYHPDKRSWSSLTYLLTLTKYFLKRILIVNCIHTWSWWEEHGLHAYI